MATTAWPPGGDGDNRLTRMLGLRHFRLAMPGRPGDQEAPGARHLQRCSYCGWGGWGGSPVMVDMEAGLTVSYVMNQMLDQRSLGDDRALEIVIAAYDGLE